MLEVDPYRERRPLRDVIKPDVIPCFLNYCAKESKRRDTIFIVELYSTFVLIIEF